MHSTDDTIAAIATAAGGAERGIVRISGPDAAAIATRVFTADVVASSVGASSVGASSVGVSSVATERERRPVARAIPGIAAFSPASSTVVRSLPATLFLWPTARSYTRQPIAELHTLGSPPLLAALLRAVCLAGARLAEPGEFTLRAFLAGRLDLMQAEAVLGVIDAADRRQLDVALTQLAGGLSGPLASLRDELLNLLADLEAGLDFTEEDLQFISSADLQTRLKAAAANVGQLLDRMHTRTRAEIEARVALVGWPNVGKSSLFNALLGQSAALVSDLAGTTRDYLTAPLSLGELTCRMTDTAGRDFFDGGAGPLADAQQLSVEQSEQADLRILCLDSTRGLNPWERSQFASGERQLVVFTKCDATAARETSPAASASSIAARLGPECDPELAILETSAATGAGLVELKRAIHDRLTNTAPAGAIANTAVRCHESLRLAADCLTRAGDIAANSGGEELIAAETRAALVELGKVVGTIYTDDILARVFSRFCIGK